VPAIRNALTLASLLGNARGVSAIFQNFRKNLIPWFFRRPAGVAGDFGELFEFIPADDVLVSDFLAEPALQAELPHANRREAKILGCLFAVYQG
jgi:hypothetical protein